MPLAPAVYGKAGITVEGTDTEAESRSGLPGANIIIVKGTMIGKTTDMKGHYSIEAPSASDTLVFSRVVTGSN